MYIFVLVVVAFFAMWFPSNNKVVEAVNHPDIFNIWVVFPRNRAELAAARDGFYNLYGILGIVGTIDCTHVATVEPKPNDTIYPYRIYINRKNYQSINICDSTLRILSVNVRFPGSTHDSYIWNQSEVVRAMRELVQHRIPGFYLIDAGGAGYPLWQWLQTPLGIPEPGSPEYRYTVVFLTARSSIERCNGLLKMRFRYLLRHRTLRNAPSKA